MKHSATCSCEDCLQPAVAMWAAQAHRELRFADPSPNGHGPILGVVEDWSPPMVPEPERWGHEPEPEPPEESPQEALQRLLDGHTLSHAREKRTEPLGTALPLYSRTVHALVGRGESCKSLLLGHSAMTVAARGHKVLIIDGEMSPWKWRERLENMGAKGRADILSNIVYLSMSEPRIMSTIHAVASEFRLIGVDSLAQYLACVASVRSENDNIEVAKALTPWTGIAATGPAVLLIDHVAASSEHMVSRGATAKFNGLDLAYGMQLEAGHAPNKETSWSCKITVEKDRDALLGNRRDRMVTFHPGGNNDLGLSFAESTEQSNRLSVDPVALKVAEISRLDPPPTSATDAYKQVGGKKDTTMKAYKLWSGSRTSGTG